MSAFNRVIVSSVSLIFILVILQFAGIANVSFALIFSFLMMLVGLVTFSWLFGTQRRWLLGSSAMMFFFGLLWFLQKVFHYTADGKEFILAIILVSGFSSLMVYFEDITKNKYLLTAVVLIVSGFVLLFRNTGFSFADAVFWGWEIVKKIWMVFVILLAYLLIVSRKKDTTE